MCKAALSHQEIFHGSASLLAAVVGINNSAFDDLVEWIKSGPDTHLTDLMGIARMEIPAFGAGIVRVEERGSSNCNRFPHFVHVIHVWESRARGRDVFARRMADRKHSGDVFLPAALHDAMLAAGRSERGLSAVSGQAGCLDVGICGRLVVVHDDEQVVVGLQCTGDGTDPHITATEVAAKRNGIDRLILDLAFALESAQAGSHPYRRGPSCAELRVHPGHNPRRGHVAGIGDVHATGRTGNDRSRTRCLDEAAHRCRRFASLTGAMTRCIEFFQRDFVNAFDLVVDNRFSGHVLLLYLASGPPSGSLWYTASRPLYNRPVPPRLYSRTPTQVTTSSSLSSVLDLWAIWYIRMQSSMDTSRPPRPVMMLVIAGRSLSGYSAERTSCISIPPSSG